MKQKIYPWLILASCCALQISAFGFVGMSSGLFYAPVSAALGVGQGVFTLHTSFTTGVVVLLMPAMAKLMQRYDMRIVLSVGLILQMGGFLVFSMLSRVWQFCIAAALTFGVGGAAVMYLPVPILLNNWFHEKHGLVMGIAMAFSGIGSMLINPVIGHIIVERGWRAAYVVIGTAGLAVTLPFTLFVVRGRPSEIGLHPYGERNTEGHYSGSKEGEAPCSLKGTGSTKNTAFVLCCLFAFFVSAISAQSPHITGFALNEGLGMAMATNAASMAAFGTMFGKIAIGVLCDRAGVFRTVPIGAAAGILSSVCMLLCHGRVALILGGAFLMGAAGAMATLVIPLVVHNSFGNERYEVVFAQVNCMSVLVSTFGIPLFGLLFDKTSNYHWNHVIIAFGMILSVVALFWLKRDTEE